MFAIQQKALHYLLSQNFLLVTDKEELSIFKTHVDDFYESINIFLKKYNQKLGFWAFFSLEPNGEVIELESSPRLKFNWLKPSDNIKAGDTVLLAGFYKGMQSEEVMIRKYLKYRQTYEVAWYETGDFYSNIFLKEYPTISFNAIFFCHPQQEFTEPTPIKSSYPMWINSLG